MRRALAAGLMPADDGVRHAVGGSEIGLDVEQRRAVQAIQPDNRQGRPLDLHQPHHAHGDGIGAGRRAQGEGAALDAVLAGNLEHQGPGRLIHPVDQNEVAAGLDVLEAVGPAQVDLDGADGVGFLRVFRAVLALFPGRPDAADEIDPVIGIFRQIHGLFAFPNAKILCHGGDYS